MYAINYQSTYDFYKFYIYDIGKFLYGMDLSSPKDSKTMSHVGGCGYANCVECFREDLKFKLEV